MSVTRQGPWPVTVPEIAALRRAERDGGPLLLFRDDAGAMVVQALVDKGRLTVGRDPGNDVRRRDDPAMSRAHAVLEAVGGGWTVMDAGMSRNGTFVNGQRVLGQRALRHADALRMGNTTFMYWWPEMRDGSATVSDARIPPAPRLTPAQTAVVTALCRPQLETAGAPTATNLAIADELCLSVSAVKAHLRVLYVKFGLQSMAQSHKRVGLAAAAIECGVVARRGVA